jgi:hypothetical protein
MPCCAGHKVDSKTPANGDQPIHGNTDKHLPCWNVSSVDTLSLTLDPYRPHITGSVAMLPAAMLSYAFVKPLKSAKTVDFNQANSRAILSGASNSCVLRI